jgi:hypothetical protein
LELDMEVFKELLEPLIIVAMLEVDPPSLTFAKF